MALADPLPVDRLPEVPWVAALGLVVPELAVLALVVPELVVPELVVPELVVLASVVPELAAQMLVKQVLVCWYWVLACVFWLAALAWMYGEVVKYSLAVTWVY